MPKAPESHEPGTPNSKLRVSIPEAIARQETSKSCKLRSVKCCKLRRDPSPAPILSVFEMNCTLPPGLATYETAGAGLIPPDLSEDSLRPRFDPTAGGVARATM